MTRGTNASLRALFVAAAVIVAVLLLASTVQASGELDDAEPRPTVEYTVRHGDSLWSIAETYATPGADVRAMIEAIRSLNDLQGSTIHSGQTLAVPGS